MNPALESVIRAVLYEGYALYPYRPSALKNRQRWMFGVVYPAGREPSAIRAECLAEGEPGAKLEVRVGFLRLGAPPRSAQAGDAPVVIAESWDHAEEETVLAPAVTLGKPTSVDASFALAGREGWPAISGCVGVAVQNLAEGLYKVCVRIVNQTPCPEVTVTSPTIPGNEQILRCSLVSTHAVLTVQGGRFVSLLDPPVARRAAAAACQNRVLWPVLAGEYGGDDTLLFSPIILGDHPRIAPESPGEFFDGSEIDEMLALRILTLTPAEKAEMRGADERTRRMLGRVESMSAAQIQRLHGALRPWDLVPGARVRLKPRPGGDIWDLMLRGRNATVECVEEDLEGRRHVAVVVDDDPGRDLGWDRQTGHRFFFAPDEMEVL